MNVFLKKYIFTQSFVDYQKETRYSFKLWKPSMINFILYVAIIFPLMYEIKEFVRNLSFILLQNLTIFRIYYKVWTPLKCPQWWCKIRERSIEKRK